MFIKRKYFNFTYYIRLKQVNISGKSMVKVSEGEALARYVPTFSTMEVAMDANELPQKEIARSMEETLERMLAPVVSSISKIEILKRQEYLTPEEVEAVYSLKATTLANKRFRAQGPEFVKDGGKILYSHKAVKAYLERREVRTADS